MTTDFEALSKIMNARYSCRAYLESEVPVSDIEDMTRLASQVPTWCNAQPWHVVVTRGEKTKEFARTMCRAVGGGVAQPDYQWPEQYSGVFKDRRRKCGFQLYDAVGIDRADKPQRTKQMLENFRFFGAPHVAIVTTEAELGPYGAMDTGGFIAAFTVAARAKGIASIVQASVAGYAPTVRAFFDLPENRKIQAVISFGYEDPKHPANQFRTPRADVADVLKMEG